MFLTIYTNEEIKIIEISGFPYILGEFICFTTKGTLIDPIETLFINQKYINNMILKKENN